MREKLIRYQANIIMKYCFEGNEGRRYNALFPLKYTVDGIKIIGRTKNV